MAHVILDQTQETTTTSGTGPYVLAGAVSSLHSFAAGMADGDTTDICIYDGTAGTRLIAEATYSTKNNSLTIGAIYSSTASGNAAVNFAGNAGTTVSAVIAAETINGLITAQAQAQTTVISGVSSISESAGTITFVDSATGNTYLLPAQPQQSLTGISITNNLFLSTQGSGYLVGTLSVQGTGISGITPSYSIATDPTNGGFAISGSTLSLASAVTAGNYTLQITVSVAGLTKTFPLAVTSVAGSKITGIGISNNTLSSGAAGTIVGALGVTGLGNPTASAFTLSGTNAADFTVDTSNNLVIGGTALAVGSYSMNVTAIPTSPNLPTPTNVSGQILDITGSGSDLFVLEITQAFYQTGAQFTVSVTPQGGSASQLGGVFTATALAGSATPDLFVFRGAFGPNPVFSISQVNFNNNGTAAAPSELRTINIISAVYNDAQATSITTPFYPTQASQFPILYSFPDPTFTQLETITIQAAEKITGIILSNTAFEGGQPAGEVVGTLSLTGSGLSGTPVYSIDPTKSPNFTIANGNQVVTAAANLTAGATYSPFITVTLAGASNSPYTQQIPLTCTAPPSTGGGTPTTSGTQEINGLTLTDINGNNLTTVEAGTAQYTQLGVFQAIGSAGPLADPITYSLASQSGPITGAFMVTNYRELLVNSTTLPAGTYNITVTVTCAAGANSPQSYPFTITVQAAGTITLNPVASSIVRGEQMMLTGTYTGVKPQFIGYALNGNTVFCKCYNVAIDSPSAGSWSAIAPAPTLVNASNTIQVCKGWTGVVSAASNTFATTDYDNTLRLFFTPHDIAPNYPGAWNDYQIMGSAYASGGDGPYTFATSINNGGTYYFNSFQVPIMWVPSSGGLVNGAYPTLTLTVTDAAGNTAAHDYTVILSPFATGQMGSYNFYSDEGQQAVTPQIVGYTMNPLGASARTTKYTNGNGDPNLTYLNESAMAPWGTGYWFQLNNYGGTTAYGDYPFEARLTTGDAGGFTINENWMMLLLHDVAPFNVNFVQGPNVNTATPAGFPAGRVYASTLTNTAVFSLLSGSSNLKIDSSSGAVTVTAPLPAGAFTFEVSVTNLGHYGITPTTVTFTLNVGTGNILPPSNMTATIPTNLSNFMASIFPNGVNGVGNGGFGGYSGVNGGGTLPVLVPVVTPTVSGMSGTITWSFHQNNVAAYLGDAQGIYQVGAGGNRIIPFRYVQDSSTGVVSAQAYISAEVDIITVTAFDGTNSCTQSFNVVVSSVQGPTFHVGQGMSTQYPSGGYEQIEDCTGSFTGSYGGQIFSGQTILIYPNSNINYYANDNGTKNSNDDLRHGINGVVTFEGVTGGAMPRLGGVYGTYYSYNGVGPTAQGFFLANSGDQSYSNLTISYVTCVTWGGTPSAAATDVAAIGITGQQPGNVSVSNCMFESCDMGVHSADDNRAISLSNLYARNCGVLFNGSGPMHNFYIGACWQLSATNILSMRTCNGHLFKNRAQNSTISHCRFLDTERGQASNQLNMPNGGAHTLLNNVFHGAPQSQQNGHQIETGDDMQYYTNIQQFMIDSSSNTYITNASPLWGPVAMDVFGWTSKTTGNYTHVSSTNDSFFGQKTPASPFNLNWATSQCNAGTGIPQSFPIPLTMSGNITLTAQPTLDFTTPITPAVTTRPGPIVLLYDGEHEQQYVGEMFSGDAADPQTTWANQGMGQIDIGSDDFHISASASPVGTKITTVTATGLPYYQQNPTQPDIRINPYGSGTTWSLLYNVHAYVDGSFPLAPSGMFLINSTTGDLTVGQALTPGTYQICPQAQASSANGSYFTWQIMYIVVGP